MTDHPTPETDAIALPLIDSMNAANGDLSALGSVVCEVAIAMIAKASNLERRLAACRAALKEISETSEVYKTHRDTAREALAATALQ